MTAEQLTTHLVLSDPRVQAERLDAQLWIAADQLGRAKEIYNDLRSRGVSEAVITAEEGVAFAKGGDISYARNLFSRSIAAEPDEEGSSVDLEQKLLTQSAYAAAPAVSLEIQDFTDSDTNAIAKALFRGSAVYRAVRFGGWAGESEYADRRNPDAIQPRIRASEGGAALRWFVRPDAVLEGRYARRHFFSGAEGFSDEYAVAASAQLFAPLKLTLRDGIGNVETAAAIHAGRRYRADGAGAEWDPALNWKGNVDYDRTRFNDSNLEQDLRLRLSKRFSERVSLGAAYFRGDSNTRQPEYYTPRNLSQYTAVLSLNQRLGELNPRTGLAPAETSLQYEGGYGVEPAGGRLVQSVKGNISWRPLDAATLSVGAQYAQSPTYISRRLEGALTVAF